MWFIIGNMFPESHGSVVVTGFVAVPAQAGKIWSISLIRSKNQRLVGIKLLELTLFLSPNLSVYFNFVRGWGLLW